LKLEEKVKAQRQIKDMEKKQLIIDSVKREIKSEQCKVRPDWER